MRERHPVFTRTHFRKEASRSAKKETKPFRQRKCNFSFRRKEKNKKCSLFNVLRDLRTAAWCLLPPEATLTRNYATTLYPVSHREGSADAEFPRSKCSRTKEPV